MRVVFSFLALAFLFISCDDGDVFSAELDFDDTFDVIDCADDLICYKLKTSPTESLSVVLDVLFEDLIETEVDTANPLLVNLVDPQPAPTVNSFNYRTYSNTIDSGVFCSTIPPADLGVTNDYTSSGVEALFTIVLTEDDNDGIPAEFEDDNLDGDDDPATNPTDTDGDGLPDYLDTDDDGDNVLTTTEMPNFSDEFELTQALDTDLDGIPNYLDNNDDDDAILTINEDTNGNLNPADDIDNNTVGADYLNPAVADATITPATAYRAHTIQQSFQLSLTLSNIVISILNQDTLEFGTLTETDSRTVTPTF